MAKANQLQNLTPAEIESARLLREMRGRTTDLRRVGERSEEEELKTEELETEELETEALETEELEQQTATSEVLQATEGGPPSRRLAESDTSEISCIGPGMTVVGKMSSEGTLNVFGRVEGELHASIVRISDGAQVEGTIAAQELTIGGRFKGTIQANCVTLTSSAVVEGDIHHRSLVIEENAWFAGVSRPEEASASKVTDPGLLKQSALEEAPEAKAPLT